jgi:hypothetical protein
MFQFDQRRWRVFVLILGVACGLAYLGVWLGFLIPFLGQFLFIAGLAVWYVVGILFGWTGFFEFSEFGATPASWPAHVVMMAFYAAVAVLASLPFHRGRKR